MKIYILQILVIIESGMLRWCRPPVSRPRPPQIYLRANQVVTQAPNLQVIQHNNQQVNHLDNQVDNLADSPQDNHLANQPVSQRVNLRDSRPANHLANQAVSQRVNPVSNLLEFQQASLQRCLQVNLLDGLPVSPPITLVDSHRVRRPVHLHTTKKIGVKRSLII